MESTRTYAKGLAALRIAVGAGFLYAGVDKVVHFAGDAKAFDAAGFLKFATGGTLPGSAEDAIVNPTHAFWVDLAGNPGLMSLVNTLVVFGEIAIGLALILGIATRFAGVMGTLMMALFWIATFDFAHGFINEQFLYGAVSLFVAYSGAGEAYGLDAFIDKARIVTQHPRLKLVLS
jgi:thiosulfate dehydrogenase [quinone] large subunit